MRALEHVHGQGYIHRDIKQDNILLCLPDSMDRNFFVVKIADFGCAALKEDCIAPAGARRMMGPELLLLGQAPCFVGHVERRLCALCICSGSFTTFLLGTGGGWVVCSPCLERRT